ncbi:MAG: fatty acid desaturase [Acidimicrobiia bacterium]
MVSTILLGALVGFAVSMFANLCTTIYLHRALSHRALTVRRPLSGVFRVLIWTMTGIRPRQWVAVHRKHHAFTDVEGDPHSPELLGWVNVQIRNVALYRREASNPQTVARYAKDLPADRWDRALFDRAIVGLAIGTVLLVLVLGPWAGAIAAFVHLNVYLATSSAVNAMGHHFGRRPYDNIAGNLQWLAWLTAGEGLHNNHHAAPTSARLAHHRWEFDPGWWAIRAFQRVGLVKVRLSSTVLAARPRKATRSAA